MGIVFIENRRIYDKRKLESSKDYEREIYDLPGMFAKRAHLRTSVFKRFSMPLLESMATLRVARSHKRPWANPRGEQTRFHFANARRVITK